MVFIICFIITYNFNTKYRQGNIPFLSFLLESCGADIDLTKDRRGRTLIDFVDENRNNLKPGVFTEVYKCVCAHVPYMTVNLFERKIFLSEFYNRLQGIALEINDVSIVVSRDKVEELLKLIPPEVMNPPHWEPDVAHFMGLSSQAVIDMVKRGADVASVITGFPILSRFVHARNCEAVNSVIELSGFRCDLLFVIDKTLKLPTDYVVKEGKEIYNIISNVEYLLHQCLYTHVHISIGYLLHL